MDLENQKLSSPYYPEDYFADGNGCEWLITAPEGNIISLEFDFFSVSKNPVAIVEIFISCTYFFSSWIYITLLLCLMEYVIKQWS